MFVVDDLVTWLIERLADAGYQKVTTRLRGSDQARAFRAAVTTAVQATVGEIGPLDEEKADRVAEQINKAFRRREPVPLPPGQPTLLEALQAGIAGQLSALDDAGLPSGNLRVPVSVVAGRLAGHLISEIMIRGSQGGPLTPLADQLNHDLTHLQGQRIEDHGQRIEGLLAQLLDRPGDGLASPTSAAGPPGWLLAEVGDPFALEVHRPVDPDVQRAALPALPAYVPREHDAALAEVVAGAAAGTSGIVVLVGGSSTGKTRACWQALELLRGQEEEWRLWHPIDPSRPAAALAQLAGIGPRTVVWLNEAQFYLGPADGTGEQVAARFRELLRDRDRGPVLVLATMWPQFWAELTVRPSGSADPHAQARELLAGHDIRVPAAFTDEQLRELEGTADPRLAQAAAGSRDGQVIQYLAGAPELLARYYHALPAARALIDAAMDAGRLGMRPALPQAFLAAAAPGYLTETDWDLLPGDWLEQALDYTAKPAKGVRGPLTPIRPRPAPGAPASTGDQPAWQLADYLDQHGRHARREEIPPGSFWAAAFSYAYPADLRSLGKAAEDRGLPRDAARLFKKASALGNLMAGVDLVRLLRSVHPGDPRPADWAVIHASPDDPDVHELLGELLLTAGATSQFTKLASLAAAHARLDNPWHVAWLLNELRTAGATGQVTALLARDPAAHASLDNPWDVAELLIELRAEGATGQATALADRAAAHASLDNPIGVARLLGVLCAADATGQATALLARDPAAHASLESPSGVGELLIELREAGATGQATALADRAAAHASLDNPWDVARLLGVLREAGTTGQVTALLARDPAAHASLDDPRGVEELMRVLREVGATGQVAALADRAAAHASLDDPRGEAILLAVLCEAGATGQVTALLARDPAAHANLDNPRDVADLLRALREAGATGQVTALASYAAAHASLADLGAVASLLYALYEAGATGQVATLADRAAAHASLDDPRGVEELLRALREAGTTGQVTALLGRDPAAHANLDNPRDVADLLRALREAGATGQVTALASRAAAYVSLADFEDVQWLLRVLHGAGARAQAAELIERLPAAGQFHLFCFPPYFRQADRASKFRFGREADGRPATRWVWTDLG